MKKLLIASAVSAALAAPATALAQAAAKAAAVPTLDKVLEASGITVNGYIDAAYSYADRASGSPTRVFDTEGNSFVLHQAALQVAKQPKEGFGGLLNITAGKDAQVIHSVNGTAATDSSLFDVTQAYGQYAKGPLTVIAGKFVTLQGTEVIWSPTNTNFSRSILFGAIPFTHTGVRGTYALSDTASFTVGLNNGWDQISDVNRGKTLELGTSLNPIKPLTIVGSYYSGQDTAVVGGAPAAASPQGARNSLDLVATYIVSDPLSIGFEFLSVTQENFTSLANGSNIKAKYNGEAVYITYMMTPKWRGVLRFESFDDKDGFHFGTNNTTYKEVTATVSFLAHDNYELRGEVRRDNASNQVFTDTDGGMSKTLTTYAIQGIFKF
jgi:hypothetical protein